jgi:hypothetical protein
MAGVVETLATLGFPEAVDDAQLLQRDGSYTRAVEFLLDMIDAPLGLSPLSPPHGQQPGSLHKSAALGL